MAIIWADFPSNSLGMYGTDRANMLNGVWAGFSEDSNTFRLTDDPDPSVGSGGRVLRVVASSTGGSPDRVARIVLPAGDEDTVGVGFRVWLAFLPLGNSGQGNTQWYFRTSANSDIVLVRVHSDGGIGVYDSANTLLGQSGPAITANAYNHVETKVVRDGAAGTVEVRVNGVVKLALTGLALGSSDIGIVGIGCDGGSGGALTSYYKDFVLWDGTGGQNNDFLGSCAVIGLRTTSDVDLGGWTPSTGSTGWDILNKSTPNDTTYISASDPPPSPASFELGNLPPDIVSVRAIIPVTRSRKIDGGDGNLQVGLTGTLTDLGADKPITTAFTYRWDVSELSPDTGTPWTPVEVDDVKLDLDRTL